MRDKSIPFPIVLAICERGNEPHLDPCYLRVARIAKQEFAMIEELSPSIMMLKAVAVAHQGTDRPTDFDFDRFGRDAEAYYKAAKEEHGPDIMPMFVKWATQARRYGIVFRKVPEDGSIASPFLPGDKGNEPVVIVANQDAYGWDK